jgi:hypothetical protein
MKRILQVVLRLAALGRCCPSWSGLLFVIAAAGLFEARGVIRVADDFRQANRPE